MEAAPGANRAGHAIGCGAGAGRGFAAARCQAAPAAESVTVQADLAREIRDLAAQVNAVQAQVAADHGTLSTLQENSVDLTKLTARMSQLNALETARMALDAGQPVGQYSERAVGVGAVCLCRAPQSEAQLRLDFPAAARAAEAASIAGAARGNSGRACWPGWRIS